MKVSSPLPGFRVALVALLCFAAPLARAIVLDFSVSGIGSYAPASAANNDAEVTVAVNALINWFNGGPNPSGGGITYTLTPGSGLPPPALPTPAVFGFKDDAAPFVDITLPGYTYLLAKYGNVAYVFYLGNLAPGSYSLPAVGPNGLGLSHEVAFTTQTTVPDGGTTMALLGLGLLALEVLRRRIRLA